MLARGLRPSKRMPRNTTFLTTCDGMVGRDGVLQSIDELTAIDVIPSEVIGTDALNYRCILNHSGTNDDKPITGANYATYWKQTGSSGVVWVIGTGYKDGIADGFPYPQIFVFINFILICGETGVFEWDGSTLTRKITVTAGGTWDAADFYDFIYLSNGKVAVARNAQTGVYGLSDTLPIASGICNYNGRVIVGAPGMAV